MSDPTPPTPPDDKDWTWVLTTPCDECSFRADRIDRHALGALTRMTAAVWTDVVVRADATTRPDPTIWSPLEYGCHVRDVYRIFDERVRSMLDSDNPLFANWDQDVTAVEERYDQQDPASVARELAASAAALATTFDAVGVDDWDRPGRRSNGSVFTIDSIGRYFLHDVVHHLNDVDALDADPIDREALGLG